jgi:O-antigen/teichoic acid export membrane protein
MALGATSLLAVIVAPMQGLHLRLRDSGAVWPRVVQHWSFGSWLILGVFAIWGAGQLYPFMLKMTAGEIAVGALLASRNLLNAIGVLIQSINSYLPSRAKVVFEARGTDALGRYLREANRKIAIIGCGFCFIVALWAPEILALLYGAGYASGAQALRVLALGSLFSVFTIIPGIGLMALGRTKTIFLSNVAGTLFATTGGWYLVSRYGLDGAAASVTIGLALAFIIQGVALSRELNAAARPAR